MSEPALRSPDLLRKLSERIREIETGRPSPIAALIPFGFAALVAVPTLAQD